jgi:hypothetical protein
MSSQIPMQQQQQQYQNTQIGNPFDMYVGTNNFQQQQQGLYQQHPQQLQHPANLMNPQHNNFPFNNDYYHMNNTQSSFSNGNGK